MERSCYLGIFSLLICFTTMMILCNSYVPVSSSFVAVRGQYLTKLKGFNTVNMQITGHAVINSV